MEILFLEAVFSIEKTDAHSYSEPKLDNTPSSLVEKKLEVSGGNSHECSIEILEKTFTEELSREWKILKNQYQCFISG